MQVAACFRQVLVGSLAEPSYRIDGVNEQVLGVGEMFDQRRDVGQHSIQDIRPATHIHQQPVGGVDGVGDVIALLVELASEGVQLAQEGPDLVPSPVHDVVDLVLQHFQVGDAATAQDQERLASVCSVVGYADEFFSGMVSPSLSSSGDGFGGSTSSTC